MTGDGSKGEGGTRFTRDTPSSVKAVVPATGGCGVAEAYRGSAGEGTSERFEGTMFETVRQKNYTVSHLHYSLCQKEWQKVKKN